MPYISRKQLESLVQLASFLKGYFKDMRQVGKELMLTRKFLEKDVAGYVDKVDKVVDELKSLEEQLKRHRRPVRNQVRDAEIKRLSDEGRSSGEIAQDLLPRYPKITAEIVRAVLFRLRNRS